MSNTWVYPLSIDTWGEAERTAVIRVLDSGRYTMGSEVSQFEREFADAVGSKYSVMVNSGSSANLLALSALLYTKAPFLSPGNEVVVPAMAWSTTYFPVHQLGMRLRFVDIDANTLNIDPAEVEIALKGGAKAILAVNLLGNPCRFDQLNDLARNYDAVLIEDNCESLGASFEGRQTGTFGKVGTFSTYFSHHLCTMEGGFITTDDEELYHVLLSARSHGWTRQLPFPNRIVDDKRSNFEETFRFVLPGYNLRPMEVAAAAGREQLKRLEGFLQIRQQNAEHFRKAISVIRGIRLQEETGKSSHFGFSMILLADFPLSRPQLAIKLEAEGIECRPIAAGCFTDQQAVRYLEHSVQGSLPCAREAHEQGLFVGNHPTDLRAPIDRLAEILSEV